MARPVAPAVVLVGFMGAGKTTLGRELAALLDWPFHDTDAEIARDHGPIEELFAERGEDAFRAIEAETLGRCLERPGPMVVALGAGAVETGEVRRLLATPAVLPLFLDADVGAAWERVRESGRPLARDRATFDERHARRLPLYREVARTTVRDLDGAVLAVGGVHVAAGALELLADHLPPGARAALVADAHVSGIHGAVAQLALAGRLASTHEVPAGERAKTAATVERLWRELELERGDAVVALGGGSTTDVAGFAAATYLRGVPWISVPTTLVGQVDAAIGGKTGIDLPGGKNLAGAFHWPHATVVDPVLLETLPEVERRNGLAEVVKTGLLAGEPLWELPDAELVRRCAAYKTALCLRDPHDRGPRNALNLGHTFAHALETAADYELPHGEAVGLGLLAALRLSGLPTGEVERVLRPRPVRVDRERAWAALRRDKKTEGGTPRLVLLHAPGEPRIGVELPAEEVRRALDELIGR